MSAKHAGKKEAQQHLAALIAEHLEQQLLAAGAAPAGLRAGDAEDAAAAPADSAALSVVLRFEGALAGECTLRCAPADATSLAGGAAPGDRAWLESLFDLLCEPLSEALFARYGRVRVHRLEDSAAVSAASTPLATLAAAGRDASTRPTFSVWGDRDLDESLGRLSRASAAAEASGLTHGNLGLVMDVELEVALRFGQRQLSLREVLELGSGSVVELDSQVDEPVELILDGRIIARGEAVIVDGNYGVRITEVLHPVMF